MSTSQSTSATLYVPATECRRPDGRRINDFMKIPFAYTEKRVQQLKLIEDEGLFFTIELIPGNLVNVCLDDQDFDFRNELTPNDWSIFAVLLEIIDNFDVEAYRKAAHDNEVFEQEGSS